MTTNRDKIFRAVIVNEGLVQNYHYNPDEFPTLSEGLIAENPIVQTIAKIIYSQGEGISSQTVYNQVNNALIGKL